MYKLIEESHIMSRKTFSVDEIKNIVNDALLNSCDDYKDFRIGQYALLETILHATGNYAGYNYLDKQSMKDSTAGTEKSVGVREWQPETSRWNFENTDDSRRYYY